MCVCVGICFAAVFVFRLQPVNPDNTTVFVGNLRSGDVTAAQLETLFGAVGPLNGVSWVAVVVVVYCARHRPLTAQAERSLHFELFSCYFSFFHFVFSNFRCIVFFFFFFFCVCVLF